MAFSAYQGEATAWGEATPDHIAEARKNSLEELLNHTGHTNAFLDLRNPPPSGAWLEEKLVSRPFFYLGEYRAHWREHIDGLFFMRKEKSHTRVPR